MNVFCPNCGSQNEAGVKFCWKCGTSLAGLPIGADQGAKPADPGAPTSAATPPEPAEPGADTSAPSASEPVPPPPAAQAVVPPPPAPPGVPPPVVPPPVAPPPPPPSTIAQPPPPAAPVIVPVAPVAPVAQPAAPPPPPAYPAPMAAAPGGGGPRSRIPMPVMIGGVIAAIAVAGGVGLVLGAGNDGPTPTQAGLPTAAPPTAVVPTASPGPIVSLQPLQTGGVTPTQGPVTPTPSPDGIQVISVDSVEVSVPSDWAVGSQSEIHVTLFTPSGGLFYLESGNLDDPITAEGMMEILIADRRDSFPDVEICLDEADSVLPNGPPSRTVILCYTGQTQSGNTYPATLFLEAGVSDGGTTYYYLKVLSDDGIWDSVVEEVIPVFDTIRWKLYAG